VTQRVAQLEVTPPPSCIQQPLLPSFPDLLPSSSFAYCVSVMGDLRLDLQWCVDRRWSIRVYQRAVLSCDFRTCKRVYDVAQTPEVQYAVLLEICEMVGWIFGIPLGTSWVVADLRARMHHAVLDRMPRDPAVSLLVNLHTSSRRRSCDSQASTANFAFMSSTIGGCRYCEALHTRHGCGPSRKQPPSVQC
jgi:hypothetical protein